MPDEADRRCEGVADFPARRARVEQVPLGTARFAAELIAHHPEREDDLRHLVKPQEMIYDGANAYLRVAGNWTGFFLGDPDRPRGLNDPLWPLDALFGAQQAVEIAAEVVRGEAVTRYRLALDLARADAALPAGVSVPAVPFRALSRIPAEVWLDGDGRARRISVVTEQGENEVPTWSILELWDFGVAADIVPPEPGDVMPPREAYRQMPA